jgi:hypothetical protein
VTFGRRLLAGSALVACSAIALTCGPGGTAVPWPGAVTPKGSDGAASTAHGTATTAAAPDVIEEHVYEGALGAGWSDWGWSPRVLGKGSAELDVTNFGGWIVQHAAFDHPFGALTFRMKAPKVAGEFLEVHLVSPSETSYPPVLVTAAMQNPLDDGWAEVSIPFKTLDPELLPFDRITFRASKSVTAKLLLDRIALTKAAAADLAPKPPKAAKPVALSVDCKAKGRAISPLIYGIAFDPMTDGKTEHQWKMKAAARRFGGNVASRYNWQLGNAWSAAKDWYWENLDFTGTPGWSYTRFLDANVAHETKGALTVPMLGWVAKDTTSYSFSVKSLGAQQSTDPYKPDAGNGLSSDGKPLPPPPPSTTSIASTPEWVKKWVARIREDDKKRGVRSVDMYILDNEPGIWSTTHRDVHPEPVSYDELLQKTIAYGTAVRAADPEAVIAGPAEWGWTNYFYSGKDAAAGFDKKPDRLAHGDLPFIAWYLKKLREHETKTKTRVLDVLDLHFYPQGKGMYAEDGGGAVDAEGAARRLRATRALWDPTYVDESWINEPVMLLPRMQKWIDENAPGVGISIGEWNFGAEKHVSGGLATAEALGRFGEHGVRSAFYWTYPPQNSPSFWAFRAFRDFDGQGGRFLDRSLPTKTAEGASIFASRDASGKHLVIIVLDLLSDQPLEPKIVLEGCGKIASERAFQYAGGEAGIVLAKTSVQKPAPTPPFSITIHDVQLDTPGQ